MPSWSPVSRRELIRRPRAHGFEGPFIGGRHQFTIMGSRRPILPNPHQSDISVELLTRPLRQAGISSEQWAALGR